MGEGESGVIVIFNTLMSKRDNIFLGEGICIDFYFVNCYIKFVGEQRKRYCKEEKEVRDKKFIQKVVLDGERVNEAYREVYETDAKEKCVGIMASGVLKENKDYISELMDKYECGHNKRISILAKILDGEYVSQTQTLFDKGGEQYTTTVSSKPTSKDVISAIKELNNMDGTYGKQKVKDAAMSSALKSIISRYNKEGNK